MLAAASLRAAFQSAVEHVQSGALAGSADSQDTKLKFYALFKASASGTCKEKEPSSFDFVKHAKWYGACASCAAPSLLRVSLHA